MGRSFRRRRVSWSGLSPDLLSSISERLECRADILHFRQTCKTWRAAAPLSLIASKNILSPYFPKCLPEDKVLIAGSVFLLQSAVNPKIPPCLLTVEELNQGKLLVRYPLSHYVAKNMPKDFPRDMDLSRFHISELSRFHTLIIGRFNGEYKIKDRETCCRKAVLFVDPKCEKCLAIDNCTVVALSYSIVLKVTRLKNGEEHKVTFKGRKFEDIVSFKGKIYAIDRTGKVCSMAYNSLKMLSVTEDSLCTGAGTESEKYLAASCDELYLVYRWWKKGGPAFKVFKLNEKEEKWDYLQGIGDDRILFVTLDGCFFASSKDFSGWKGNCIAFPAGTFSPYSGVTHDYDIFKTHIPYHDVAVFHFDSGDCFPASSNPRYSDVVRPPPSWLWTDTCLSPSESDMEGGRDEEINDDDDYDYDYDDNEGREGEEFDEEEERGRGGVRKVEPQPQRDASSKKEMSPNSVQVAKGLQTGQDDIAQEDFKDQTNVNSASAVNTLRKIAENTEKDASQVKFVGVDVSSHLVPILQKIWDNHGNIIEGNVVQSDSLLTWALESLAKMIVILQSDSGRSLNDSQAKYLNSTLLDLQTLHFKLDWLVPFVEKAVALHKENVILELKMTKSKLRAEMREVEKRLAAEQRKENQLVSGSLDLKDVLN